LSEEVVPSWVSLLATRYQVRLHRTLLGCEPMVWCTGIADDNGTPARTVRDSVLRCYRDLQLSLLVRSSSFARGFSAAPFTCVGDRYAEAAGVLHYYVKPCPSVDKFSDEFCVFYGRKCSAYQALSMLAGNLTF